MNHFSERKTENQPDIRKVEEVRKVIRNDYLSTKNFSKPKHC